MPLRAAITLGFQVKQPFYFEIGLVGDIHEDGMISDYWMLLELCRIGLVGEGERCGLPTPNAIMFSATDSDTRYLVDLYKYIKVCFSLHNRVVQSAISPPTSTDDLPWYYYAYSIYTNVLLKKRLGKEEFLELVEVAELLDGEEFKNNALNMISGCLV